MAYEDEQILKMKQKMKEEEEKKHSEEAVEEETEEKIADGMVHIYGEEVLFERKEVEEFGLSMILPKDYELIGDDFKAILYPQGNRPSHVFACGTVQGSVALNLSPSAVTNDGIKDLLPKMKILMEQVGPQTKIVSCEAIQKEERNIGVLEFISHAIDMNVYNMMTFHSIDDKLLILTISFPNKMSDRFVEIGKQIIDSIEIQEEED